ncbi:hypothetical protein BPAA_270 [Blattabacterium cuenoti BPAA]|uniref:Transmembrane protein n=1 Tax=Blattabacterium cuenoti BPAA TaxID=1229512 RepID=M5ADD1_9FLAO|nr:hypothetical protein BPAA_270 [Blattabacterium cuenoti BPAA]
MFIFIKNFIHKKWCIFRNEVIQILISIMTEIFLNFLLLILCILIFFLVSLSLCFFLSFYVGNYVIGFGILTFSYFLIFIVTFFFGKNITRFLIKNLFNKFFIKLFDNKK